MIIDFENSELETPQPTWPYLTYLLRQSKETCNYQVKTVFGISYRDSLYIIMSTYKLSDDINLLSLFILKDDAVTTAKELKEAKPIHSNHLFHQFTT